MGVGSLHLAYGFSQRPDRLAQKKHISLQVVDGGEYSRLGIGYYGILQVLEALAKLLHDHEIVVHDGIDHGIGQIVRPLLSDPAFGCAKPIPQGIEYIHLFLFKRYNEVRAEDDANLVHIQGGLAKIVALFIVLGALFALLVIEHLEHYEYVIVIILDLGALIGQNVLQDQGMNSVASAQVLQDIHLMQAVDIYPGHRGLVFKTEAFRDILGLGLMITQVAVIDDRDLGLFQALLIGQGQGRRSQIADIGTAITILQKAESFSPIF